MRRGINELIYRFIIGMSNSSNASMPQSQAVNDPMINDQLQVTNDPFFLSIEQRTFDRYKR